MPNRTKQRKRVMAEWFGASLSALLSAEFLSRQQETIRHTFSESGLQFDFTPSRLFSVGSFDVTTISLLYLFGFASLFIALYHLYVFWYYPEHDEVEISQTAGYSGTGTKTQAVIGVIVVVSFAVFGILLYQLSSV